MPSTCRPRMKILSATDQRPVWWPTRCTAPRSGRCASPITSVPTLYGHPLFEIASPRSCRVKRFNPLRSRGQHGVEQHTGQRHFPSRGPRSSRYRRTHRGVPLHRTPHGRSAARRGSLRFSHRQPVPPLRWLAPLRPGPVLAHGPPGADHHADRRRAEPRRPAQARRSQIRPAAPAARGGSHLVHRHHGRGVLGPRGQQRQRRPAAHLRRHQRDRRKPGHVLERRHPGRLPRRPHHHRAAGHVPAGHHGDLQQRRRPDRLHRRRVDRRRLAHSRHGHRQRRGAEGRSVHGEGQHRPRPHHGDPRPGHLARQLHPDQRGLARSGRADPDTDRHRGLRQGRGRISADQVHLRLHQLPGRTGGVLRDPPIPHRPLGLHPRRPGGRRRRGHGPVRRPREGRQLG